MKDYDRWAIWSVVIGLGLFLIYLFYELSGLATIFPYGSPVGGDYSSFISGLYFLKEYGYHVIVPHWYGGIDPFLFRPPGWFFFTLPFYLLTGDILLSTFVSVVLLYGVLFMATINLGDVAGLDRLHSTALYLLAFINPISAGWLLYTGRTMEMPALAAFVAATAVLYSYRSRELDWRFILATGVLMSLMIYSHPSYLILFAFLYGGLFLERKKEWRNLSLPVLLAALFSAPYLIPFLSNYSDYLISTYYALPSITEGFLFEHIYSLIPPAVFLSVLYLYRRYDEIPVLMLPMAFLAVLFLFKLAPYIPLLRSVHTDSYNIVLLFLSFLLLFRLDLSDVPAWLRKTINAGLAVIPVIFVAVTLLYLPPLDFTPTETSEDVASLLPDVDGKFVILDDEGRVHGGAMYAYATVEYNLSTASGWDPTHMSKEYNTRLSKLLSPSSCSELRSGASETGTDYFIGVGDRCGFLSGCGFVEVKSVENACLYKGEGV